MNETSTRRSRRAAPLPGDDRMRTDTARLLSEQLDRSTRLLARAGALVRESGDDALEALNAAGRILRSNAVLGAVILKAAQVEDRRRVFHVQAAAVELNPKNSKPVETPEAFDTRLEFKFNNTLAPHHRSYQFTEPEDYPPWFDNADLDPSI